MTCPTVEFDLTRVDLWRALRAWDRAQPSRMLREGLGLFLGAAAGLVGVAVALLTHDPYDTVEPGVLRVSYAPERVLPLLVGAAALGVFLVYCLNYLLARQQLSAVLASGGFELGRQRIWADAKAIHHDRPGVSRGLGWEAVGEPLLRGGQILIPTRPADRSRPAQLALVVPASAAPLSFQAVLQGRREALPPAKAASSHRPPSLTGAIRVTDHVEFARHFLTTMAGRRQELIAMTVPVVVGAVAGLFALRDLAGPGFALVLGALVLTAVTGVAERFEAGARARLAVRAGAVGEGEASWWFDEFGLHEQVAGHSLSVAWDRLTGIEVVRDLGIVWFGDRAVLVPLTVPGAERFLVAVKQTWEQRARQVVGGHPGQGEGES